MPETIAGAKKTSPIAATKYWPRKYQKQGEQALNTPVVFIGCIHPKSFDVKHVKRMTLFPSPFIFRRNAYNEKHVPCCQTPLKNHWRPKHVVGPHTEYTKRTGAKLSAQTCVCISLAAFPLFDLRHPKNIRPTPLLRGPWPWLILSIDVHMNDI